MDAATTWYGTRISGKPFETIERNPRMRKLGFKKSTLCGLLVVITVAPSVILIFYVLIPTAFPYLDRYAVVAAIFWFVFFTKFIVVFNNLQGIRKFIRQARLASSHRADCQR